MCGVWRGAIQRQRVDGMHGVWAWVCDECCGGDGRYHHMHGMCGRTVQQRVDGGVRRVSGGINDGRALGDRGDYVRGVCGWSVQCRIDDGVRCVRGWVCDEHWSCCGGHAVYGVCGWSVFRGDKLRDKLQLYRLRRWTICAHTGVDHLCVVRARVVDEHIDGTWSVRLH